MYIIAQVIGFIAFIISLSTYHQKNKVSILNRTLITNFLKIIHYLLLGAYSGFATKVIAIYRDLFVILKEKYVFLKLSFLCIYLFYYIYLFQLLLMMEFYLYFRL